MRKILFLVCLTGMFSQLFSQNSSTQLIYLTDGSFLRGMQLDTLEGGTLRLHLSDGTIIELPASLIWQIRETDERELLLSDGRKILEKGFYTSLSFHTLSAERSSQGENDIRWGLGAHLSVGHQFSPLLKVGVGAGVDAHEYFFMPVFLEAGGFFIKKSVPPAQRMGKANGLIKDSRVKRKVPFCYNLQVGYNLPAGAIFNGKSEFEKIKGSWLVYPAVGFMLPSRTGNAFRLDAGYKFQQFTRTYESIWWTNWETKDRILLKSFALRAGWYFR